MDSSGPPRNRDDPDESDGSDETPLRGWIPPDDRLWRHPSEIAASSGPGPEAVADVSGSGARRDRHTVLAAGAVGAVAVVLSMTAAFALTGTSTGSNAHPVAVTVTSLTTASTAGPLATGSGGTGATTTGPDVVAMVSALRPSLVGVVPTDSSVSTSSGTPITLTGVVLPGGKLVVTAASAAVGMHAVDVVTADGTHHHGRLAGSDAHAGVAVVTLDDALTPATFADADIAVGALAVAACLCGGSARSTAAVSAPTVSVGLVRQNGQPQSLADGTTLIDAIEASMPLEPGSWGTVLLDRQGRVAGILDSQQEASGETIGVFVPASLAVDVADTMAGGHEVAHGWLGVVCADPSGLGAGPDVTTVFEGGPAAAAGVESGDVVRAVDGHTVATIAELQARLYTLRPGTAASVTLVRGATTETVSITLAAEPA
jgi:S1-C subfamily serine protease